MEKGWFSPLSSPNSSHSFEFFFINNPPSQFLNISFWHKFPNMGSPEMIKLTGKTDISILTHWLLPQADARMVILVMLKDLFSE